MEEGVFLPSKLHYRGGVSLGEGKGMEIGAAAPAQVSEFPQQVGAAS